jgi:hypothetical protein
MHTQTVLLAILTKPSPRPGNAPRRRKWKRPQGKPAQDHRPHPHHGGSHARTVFLLGRLTRNWNGSKQAP